MIDPYLGRAALVEGGKPPVILSGTSTGSNDNNWRGQLVQLHGHTGEGKVNILGLSGLSSCAGTGTIDDAGDLCNHMVTLTKTSSTFLGSQDFLPVQTLGQTVTVGGGDLCNCMSH